MSNVKLSNSKSLFNKQNKELEDKEKFNKLADEVYADYEDKKKRAFQVGLKFLSLLDDKTLPSNRTDLSKNLERQIVSELVNLANELNNDENEQEGVGSLAILTLLIKCVLSQRDKINELDYKIHTIETTYKK